MVENLNANNPDKVEQQDKKGFSWLGLFFFPMYYAGYGKIGKGVLLGLLGLIPLIGLGAAIYSGIKARKELPIGQQNFNWIPAIGVLALLVFLNTAFYVMVDKYGEDSGHKALADEFVLDYNGVWKAENGVDFLLNFNETQSSMSMFTNGVEILKDMPVIIKDKDLLKATIILEVNAPSGLQEWRFKKLFNENGFTLLMTNDSGKQAELAYGGEVQNYGMETHQVQKDDEFVASFSGVWQADNGVQFILDVANEKKNFSMAIAGTSVIEETPLKVKSEDQQKGTVVFLLDNEGETQEWTFSKVMKGNGFSLHMSNSNNREADLGYVGEVSSSSTSGSANNILSIEEQFLSEVSGIWHVKGKGLISLDLNGDEKKIATSDNPENLSVEVLAIYPEYEVVTVKLEATGDVIEFRKLPSENGKPRLGMLSKGGDPRLDMEVLEFMQKLEELNAANTEHSPTGSKIGVKGVYLGQNIEEACSEIQKRFPREKFSSHEGTFKYIASEYGSYIDYSRCNTENIFVYSDQTKNVVQIHVEPEVLGLKGLDSSEFTDAVINNVNWLGEMQYVGVVTLPLDRIVEYKQNIPNALLASLLNPNATQAEFLGNIEKAQQENASVELEADGWRYINREKGYMATTSALGLLLQQVDIPKPDFE